MANKPYNVENWSYSLNLIDSSIKNANADANYGPWTSIDDTGDSGSYMTWLRSKGPNSPKEGTLIAVQPTEHADVTLYVYTSNVGDGTWKPVSSGGTGADDIGYIDHNVDVQLLNKQVVSTSANQNLTLEQQANARANIKAANVDDVYTKSEVYTKTAIDGIIRNVQAAAGGDLGGYYTSLLVNENFVNLGSVDQTINGQKTFDGAVIFNHNPNPVLFKYDVTINGTLKYTKPKPSEISVEGFLVRDTDNKVLSKTLVAGDVLFSETETSGLHSFTYNNNLKQCLTKLDTAVYNLSQAQSQSGNAGTLTTTSIESLSTDTAEPLTGAIQLHQISKTGSYGDLLNKPITVSGTNNENASIAKNLIIGTEQSNKDLTVNGDVTITGDLTIGTGSSITTPSAGISSAQIGLLSLGNLTANSILKLDGNKKVVSDTGTFMKYKDEVNSYADLPDENAEGISKGDVIYVKDNDTFVIASSITNDNNLYVRIPGLNLVTLDKTTQPAVSYSSVKTDLYRVHEVFSAYPLIDYYYHTLPAGSDGRLRVIPITTNIEGEYALVLASTQKIFAVTTQDSGGPKNSWYCTGLDNTGEVKDITSSFSTSDNSVQRFKYLLNSIVWTGTKDYVLDNTIKFAPQTLTEAQKARARQNIGALGADNINSVFNATYYAAGFNSPEKTELDDNLAFEKIGSLLNAGIVPTLCVLEDGISCYYTYWKYIPTGSALDEWGIAGTEKDYHAFSTWKYEDGSLKFKVQLCESGSLNLTTKYIPDATQS